MTTRSDVIKVSLVKFLYMILLQADKILHYKSISKYNTFGLDIRIANVLLVSLVNSVLSL